MSTVDLVDQPLVGGYDRIRARLPGAGLPWLSQYRQYGLACFAESGLPSRKAEAWKYTDLAAVARTDFVHVSEATQATGIDRVPALLPEAEVAARLVFVDGRFSADLSALGPLPAGVVLEDLATAMQRRPETLRTHFIEHNGLGRQPLLALNTAFMDGGLVLTVPRGVVIEQPIEVIAAGGFAERPVVYHPRILIDLAEGAHATVVEHWVGGGSGTYMANGAVDVRVGANANLRHYRVQDEGRDAYHVSTLRAALQQGAVYEAFALSLGGRLSRLEARVSLDGSGAHCGFSGAFLMRDAQHCDNTTVIEHRAPHTSCREVFKGVLDDRARGVFQGRIVVHRDAQKTDGHQSCKTLLLSDAAEIDAKPELEIYADDVKCSHGATAGDLDTRALFYLRSRGIDEAAAHRLLIAAFIADALDEISFEPIRERLKNRAEDWLLGEVRSPGPRMETMNAGGDTVEKEAT